MSGWLEELISSLRGAGWRVRARDTAQPLAIDEVARRHDELPEDYRSFLEAVELCTNRSDTSWFMTARDYRGESDAAFKWNAYELQSLVAADGDQDWCNEIRQFWDCTLPILMSVGDGYTYLGLKTKGAERGVIVIGREPEYEEARAVCRSFAELAQMIEEGLAAGTLDGALASVLG